MKYILIENLPAQDEISKLQSTELKSLADLWLEKKKELENSGEYQQFIKKMQREWAIETGIIERLYTWDRGITETLIEQGIDSSIINHSGGLGRDKAENVAKLIGDQESILEGLFAFVKGEQPFSEHYIRSMHEKFTAHQDHTEAVTPDGGIVEIPLLKGKYKEQPNNPRRPDGGIHEYCPPEFVNDEMGKLIKIYTENENSIPSEILSAWVHHKFTQIHPFQDGNGRIARAIASLVFLKSGLFPLVVRGTDREDYISALEKADNGDIHPLVKLFSKLQRYSILSALEIQQQVEQAKHAKQIISSTLALLTTKSKAKQEELSAVYLVVANKLQDIVELKLSELQKTLDPQLREIKTYEGEIFNASLKMAKNDEKEAYYYQRQIYEVANIHDYFANLNRYKSWGRLVIFTGKIFEIVFSIHGHGRNDNEVVVVSGFTFEKIPSESGNESGSESTNAKPCSQELFQFNCLEDEKDTINRFEEWIDDSIANALAEWQKTIT